MGFSVSAGTAIVVIAAVASVGMLYTTGYNSYEQLQEAHEIDQDTELATINTALEITTISYNGTTVPDTVTVTAKNTGSTALTVNDTDLLFNGTYTPVTDASVSTTQGTVTAGAGGTDLWQPHETLTLTVEQNVSTPIAVKLVTENGVAATEVGP